MYYDKIITFFTAKMQKSCSERTPQKLSPMFLQPKLVYSWYLIRSITNQSKLYLTSYSACDLSSFLIYVLLNVANVASWVSLGTNKQLNYFYVILILVTKLSAVVFLNGYYFS